MCRGMRCQSAHLSVRFASMSPRTRNQARFRQSCGPLTSLSTNQITAGQGSPDGRQRECSGRNRSEGRCVYPALMTSHFCFAPENSRRMATTTQRAITTMIMRKTATMLAYVGMCRREPSRVRALRCRHSRGQAPLAPTALGPPQGGRTAWPRTGPNR